MAIVVEGDPKPTFSISTTPNRRGGHYSFTWIGLLYSGFVALTLIVELRRINYHLLSLLYVSTLD